MSLTYEKSASIRPFLCVNPSFSVRQSVLFYPDQSRTDKGLAGDLKIFKKMV
jgi:hypothetical protein